MFFIVGLFIIIAEKLLTLRTCLHFIGESKESAQLNNFFIKTKHILHQFWAKLFILYLQMFY